MEEVLQKLNTSELEELKTQIEYLLLQRKKKNNYGDYELLLDSLNKVLSKKLRHKPINLSILKTKNKTTFNKLASVSDTLNTFLLTSTSKCDKILKLKFYALYAELVSEAILESEIALSLSTMLSFVDQFPGLLNKAYPSYLESGLLLLVLGDTND